MASDFIFMLTHADRTIPDAHDRVPEALAAGVGHIGFKDIGLPVASLRRLADTNPGGGGVPFFWGAARPRLWSCPSWPARASVTIPSRVRLLAILVSSRGPLTRLSRALVGWRRWLGCMASTCSPTASR